MTASEIRRKIASIEEAIRQTYDNRHQVNRRYRRTALDEIREYIKTLKALRTALSCNA
jgi:hypothetical protein